MLHKAPILFFPQMFLYEHQTERYNTMQRLLYRKGMLRDEGRCNRLVCPTGTFNFDGDKLCEGNTCTEEVQK